MANLRELNRKLQIVFAVLIGFNVLAAGALLYIWVRGTNALPAEFRELHELVQTRKAAVVSPEVVNERIKQSREQIAKFYEDRFPNSSAAIFETLGRVANENKVKLNQAAYKMDDTDLPDLKQVEITATLDGDYTQAMKFINSLEREKLFFLVNGVKLGDQNAGQVRLAVTINTFMKGRT